MRALVALSLAMLPASALHAQGSPSAALTPASTPKQIFGFVRFWNMLPGKPGEELQLLTGEDKPLTASPFGNFYAGYLPLAPGTYNFIVQRLNDRANPLKRQPVVLRADTYITFLVTDKNGQPNVELIDDTLDPKNPDGPCHLVLRDFFPKAAVTVSVGTQPAAPLSYGETRTIDNLPAVITPLNMQASGISLTPKTWSTEADFKTIRHATLLIVPDFYGRFRPRLVFDGIKSDTSLAVGAPDRKP